MQEYIQSELSKLPDLFKHINKEKLLKRVGRIISKEAFESLQGDSQISSDIINAFLHLLVANVSRKQRDIQFLSTYFSVYLSNWDQPANQLEFSTVEDSEQTLQSIINYSEQQIKKYTRKLRFHNNALIVMPIHVPGHWLLAIIDCRNFVVEFYDSYSQFTSDKWFEHWKNLIGSWLTSPNFGCEYFANRQLDFLFVTKQSRHQMSGNSCGAFICYYLMQRLLYQMPLAEIQSDPNCNAEYMEAVFREYLKNQLSAFQEIE